MANVISIWELFQVIFQLLVIISRNSLLAYGLIDFVLTKLAIRSPPPFVAVPGLMERAVKTPPKIEKISCLVYFFLHD